MIQRIQTLFLLLAGLSFGALFFIPMALSDTVTTQFLSDQMYDVTDHPVLTGMAAFGYDAGSWQSSFFKNNLQLKLGYLILSPWAYCCR